MSSVIGRYGFKKKKKKYIVYNIVLFSLVSKNFRGKKTKTNPNKLKMLLILFFPPSSSL